MRTEKLIVFIFLVGSISCVHHPKNRSKDTVVTQQTFVLDTLIGNNTLHLKMNKHKLENEKENKLWIKVDNIPLKNIILSTSYSEAIVKKDNSSDAFIVIPQKGTRKVTVSIYSSNNDSIPSLIGKINLFVED